MADLTQIPFPCPKDGASMQPMSRGDGVRRCSECRGVFIDPEALRGGRPPTWAPFVTSVLVSLLATFVVRRLRRRCAERSSA